MKTENKQKIKKQIKLFIDLIKSRISTPEAEKFPNITPLQMSSDNIKMSDIIDLPLMDKVEKWGLIIRVVPMERKCVGSYNPFGDVIELSSIDEMVFFHELAHFALTKIRLGCYLGQFPDQEIIAETSALVISALIGKTGNYSFENSYKFISSYAYGKVSDPLTEVKRHKKEIYQIVKLLLEDYDEL